MKAETNDATAGDVADTHETDFMDGEDITNNHQNDDDDDVNNKSDYDDSGDDDVQVTLRDIKEIYELVHLLVMLYRFKLLRCLHV